MKYIISSHGNGQYRLSIKYWFWPFKFHIGVYDTIEELMEEFNKLYN